MESNGVVATEYAGLLLILTIIVNQWTPLYYYYLMVAARLILSWRKCSLSTSKQKKKEKKRVWCRAGHSFLCVGTLDDSLLSLLQKEEEDQHLMAARGRTHTQKRRRGKSRPFHTQKKKETRGRVDDGRHPKRQLSLSLIPSTIIYTQSPPSSSSSSVYSTVLLTEGIHTQDQNRRGRTGSCQLFIND